MKNKKLSGGLIFLISAIFLLSVMGTDGISSEKSLTGLFDQNVKNIPIVNKAEAATWSKVQVTGTCTWYQLGIVNGQLKQRKVVTTYYKQTRLSFPVMTYYWSTSKYYAWSNIASKK